MRPPVAAALKVARERGLSAGLSVHQTRFESFVFEPESYDLIHARFSLPFCSPRDFTAVWKGLRGSLRPGGLFAGQLLGPNDSFVKDPRRHRIHAHTRGEVEALLRGLKVLHLEESERDGKTAVGTPKHWHVFDILARRP